MKTHQASLGPQPARPEPLPVGQTRLLSVLESLPGPATLSELSEASGLHPNTLRGHVEGLLDRGEVIRTSEPATGPGRPAHRYAVAGPRSAPVAELTALAVTLADAISRSSTDPAHDARLAGRAWGHRLAEDSATTEPVAVLGRMGFAPEATEHGADSADGADGADVRLTRCPLLAAAREAPDIVCGVHHGLVEGLLEHSGRSTAGVELLPFAEVGACRLRLPSPSR